LWDRVAERIRDRGGEVRYGAKVTGVEIDESPRIRAIRLIRTSAAGTATEAIEVAGAVLAVPPGVLTGLLPAQWRAVEPFNRGTGLSWSPILNLHLWFDRPVTGEPMLAVTGSPLQWIFVRPPATGYSGRDQHLDLVISAACPWLGKTPETIRDALLPELQALLPAARDAGLIAWKVVLMHRATFAPRPGSERFRPPAAGPVPNLALAGAWTATGWPSTLEGAVRSGEMAARVLQLLRDRAPSVSPT